MSVEQECLEQWRKASAPPSSTMGAVEYECLEQWCQGAMDYWVDQAETGRHMIDYVEAHRAYLKKLYEMRGF